MLDTYGPSIIYCLVFSNCLSFLIITSKKDLCHENIKSFCELFIFLDENVLNQRTISDNQCFFVLSFSVETGWLDVGAGLEPVPTVIVL